MSQEKIDAYKKEKAGRKEAIAKQKKRNRIIKISSIVVAVAIVASIAGVIIYNKVGSSASSADTAATEVSTEATSTETATEETTTETTTDDAATETTSTESSN